MWCVIEPVDDNFVNFWNHYVTLHIDECQMMQLNCLPIFEFYKDVQFLPLIILIFNFFKMIYYNQESTEKLYPHEL